MQPRKLIVAKFTQYIPNFLNAFLIKNETMKVESQIC